MKRIAILPTLLTLGNAVCGFAAISYASKIGQPDQPYTNEFYLQLAGWLIIAAMVFDSLDGYVARLSRSATKFGAELDSLCDAISFGAAPAFLLLKLGPGVDRSVLMHQTLAVFATLYMVCAILRLARFNVDSQPEVSGKKGFTGLPSPAAAGCIASLAILKGNLQRFDALDPARVSEFIEVWAMLGSIFVALLMVSKVPYPKMTRRVLTGRRHFDHLIVVVIGVFILAVAIEIAPALVFWGYVFAILAQVAWSRATHRAVEGELQISN